MFKKINKPFPFFDAQDKKRPISAPRAQNGDMKFVTGQIQLLPPPKNKADKPRPQPKPNFNFNSKGKKDFSHQIKVEGHLFKPKKYSAMGAKTSIVPHSPFDVKSRNNNNLKKNIFGKQPHSGTYKGNMQLASNPKPIKKERVLSPSFHNDNWEKGNFFNSSIMTAKSTHSPSTIAKVGQKESTLNAKKNPMINPNKIRVTKAFRSITPLIRPKYSTSSIKPKNRNTTPNNELRSNNPFYQTTKSQYGFQNHHLSFNEELNKSMKVIHSKPMKAGSMTSNTIVPIKRLRNFKSKNAFPYPVKSSLPPFSKPKTALQEKENSQEKPLINVNPAQQSSLTKKPSDIDPTTNDNKDITRINKPKEIKSIDHDLLNPLINNKVSSAYSYMTPLF